MGWRIGFFKWVSAFAMLGCVATAQQVPAAGSAQKADKICVADVANSSMTPIFTDQVKERLVKNLQEANLNAVSSYTSTMIAIRLGLSGKNDDVMRIKKCDYMLLSEVAKAQSGTPEESNQVSDGASSGAQGKPLAIQFALFKKKGSKPLLESSVPTAQAETPTAAAQAAMDTVAAQVIHFLKK